MPKPGMTRRLLLGSAAALPFANAAGQTVRTPDGFVDILRAPDSVTAYFEKDRASLRRGGARWTGRGVAVEAEPHGGEIPIRIEAPQAPLMRIHLRWRARVPVSWRVLNDQWERSYGDLEWRGLLGERVLPWYFLAYDGHATHAYGVATGANCFAFWQADPDGLSLWLDVRNGGGAVQLGDRWLDAAVVRTRRGVAGQSAFDAARQFCRVLCGKPRLEGAPVYGANNWYYAYGQNCSAEEILRDASLLQELSPAGGTRPFMVIDDGWQPTNTAGPWEHGNARFPDMAKLAAEMLRRGTRPGIWTRPLFTTDAIPDSARLRGASSRRGFTLDPTIPEMLELVKADTRRVAGWGFELIKHDYSSYDLTGRWGFAMGAELTEAGWHFADRSKTTAEVVLAFYRAIREAAGHSLVIGCNTFGHLGAGLFELQRIGDDTSGREFDRTRRMGVNTLAFRGPQQDTFFGADADCVPITPEVSWDLTASWLDLVARSGTPLFVSADPRSLNAEVRKAVKAALAAAAKPQPLAEPLDWMDTTTPGRWRLHGEVVEYDWYGPEGGTPFPR